jgi:phage baseplate assembly protein W
MSASQKLYNKIVVKGPQQRVNVPMSKTYKGFSTVSGDRTSFSLYDFALIKQDLINHFHIRQGERLENPLFGTIIWDYIFEPLTSEAKEEIVRDVETIISYDPRLTAQDVVITEYENGIQVECMLTFFPYNIQEFIVFKFDQANGIVSN